MHSILPRNLHLDTYRNSFRAARVTMQKEESVAQNDRRRVQTSRLLDNALSAGQGLEGEDRKLHSRMHRSRSNNVSLCLSRQSAGIGSRPAAISKHPRHRPATTVWFFQPAAMSGNGTRNHSARHQQHRQHNRPATPHGAIIGATTLFYEKLEKSMSSGPSGCPMSRV